MITVYEHMPRTLGGIAHRQELVIHVLEDQHVERTQYFYNFCPGPPHSFH